ARVRCSPSRCRSRREMAADLATILVVDDEPAIRRVLRSGLGVQGYSIVEADNAAPARPALSPETPDLVILHLGLPDADGLDLIREIREGSRVPIIVLSIRGGEGTKVTALDLGADDYVTKPFGMDELLARIRAALRHALQRQGEEPVFRSGDL